MIVKSKIDEIENYLVDASNTKGFCDSVYFPETVDDIFQVLKEANLSRISVTVSGNRTGVTGGGVPAGGIVISTEKLNSIIGIDEQNRCAIVQPGVLLSDLEKAVKGKNLFYPPDPTEKSCFIGGTIATNASGARTLCFRSDKSLETSLLESSISPKYIHLVGQTETQDGSCPFSSLWLQKVHLSTYPSSGCLNRAS